jgi:hypothetical protein
METLLLPPARNRIVEPWGGDGDTDLEMSVGRGHHTTISGLKRRPQPREISTRRMGKFGQAYDAGPAYPCRETSAPVLGFAS